MGHTASDTHVQLFTNSGTAGQWDKAILYRINIVNCYGHKRFVVVKTMGFLLWTEKSKLMSIHPNDTTVFYHSICTICIISIPITNFSNNFSDVESSQAKDLFCLMLCEAKLPMDLC